MQPQLFRRCPGQLRGARRIGMNAERSRAQDKMLSSLRGYLARFQEPANARNKNSYASQQRVGFIPGNKRSIIAITAVGKGFFPYDQPGSTRNAHDATFRARVDFYLRPKAFHHRDIAFGQGVVFFARVIKGPVEFDVVKRDAISPSDPFQRADLVQEKQLHLMRRRARVTAAKVASAPRPRMGAQSDAVLFCKTDARFHRRQIPRVPAASKVCRSNPAHQRARPSQRLAFAQITVEVEFHSMS